jgi:hypothetical protein
VFLNTFRLQTLGFPTCHALPHAFEFFRDEVRCAEPFFVAFAALGKTDLLRTHEVPRNKAVLDPTSCPKPSPRIPGQYGDDRSKLIKSLQARGMTYEKFRQNLREQVIVEALTAKNVSQEIFISPHKIETYYLAHQDKYKLEDQVKLSMIVLNKNSDAPARPLAEEILRKLREGGLWRNGVGLFARFTTQGTRFHVKHRHVLMDGDFVALGGRIRPPEGTRVGGGPPHESCASAHRNPRRNRAPTQNRGAVAAEQTLH